MTLRGCLAHSCLVHYWFLLFLILFFCVVIFSSSADRGYETPAPGKWGNLSVSWVERNGPKHGLLHVDTSTKEVRRLSLDDPAVQEPLEDEDEIPLSALIVGVGPHSL